MQLLNDGGTVPFISRYRKEATGNLDEVAIESIKKQWEAFQMLQKRKEAVAKAIGEQGFLTDQIKSNIASAENLTALEDLYLPYKKKRQTKATVAKQAGLEPLAKIIMGQRETNLRSRAGQFIKGSITSEKEALAGASHIIAEWVSEHTATRNSLRRLYQRKATITSKVIKGKETEKEALVYQAYFDSNELLSRCPSHRLLAMLRAEKEGVVRLKVSVEKEEALDHIDRFFATSNNEACTDVIFEAVADSYSRLLAPAIANETMQLAKQKADEAAVRVFSENLKQLLLAAPLGEKRILALDPGFKSGCKLVCLDAQGKLVHNETIYPHPPQQKFTEAIKKVKSLVNAYKIEAIAVGNGTAARETEHFVSKIPFSKDIKVFMVNESGASIYSASPIARSEFPNYDVTVRGAVSIGRRLADPLAELVKIDPKSLGVGQYQHDVNQQLLKKELDTTVSHCVNAVGINVNTASESLLSYISGIGPKLASNIVAFRTENGGIPSRKALKKVKGLGAKAFEQGAAFLRIKNGENALDNSAIHPERYALVSKMAKDLNVSVQDLIGNAALVATIPLSNYVNDQVGLLTLKDIIEELKKPGLDPRAQLKVFQFDESIRSISDLKTGMKLPGIVNNITNFGCFVDIGIKESGLIHVSKLANQFVKDPNEIVKLNQQLIVTVVEVDEARKRIQLSLID
ncbi:Tex family protein [Aquimarina agarivorans]|uniref:Tex family protein n=1 Tax=Aquimarina agarivorans TaxID=980584 RepID=UPI000248EDC2|nr:Tex family protein [Aquimarina agarivorans]